MALVISRGEETSFTIGDSIKVTIIEIRNKQARIAISAPPELAIRRDNMIKDKQ